MKMPPWWRLLVLVGALALCAVLLWRKHFREPSFPAGLLIWDAVPAVTKGQFGVRVEDHPTHEMIDEQLVKGNPVIAKVLFEGRIWHWVLICGKEGTEYSAKTEKLGI